MNSFRSLLLEIGQELRRADLDQIKFACRDFIPAGRAEFILQPHELFLELERQNKLSENNRGLLAHYLSGIGRNDLKRKLLGIEEQIEPFDWGPPRPLPAGTAKEKVTQEMISRLKLAEKISTNWKFVGRHLGLEDYVLRNIEDTYRRTEERSAEMLSKWRQNGSNKSIGFFIDALKDAGRTDLAEEVQDYSARDTFPAMNDLEGVLPQVSIRAARTVEAEEHDAPDNGEPPARAEQQNEENSPVQVSEGHGEDQKKPGTFCDETIYYVVDQIGFGGYSKVYCVMEKKTEKKLAVKTMHLGMNDKSTKEKVNALKTEIDLLKALKNDYIITYYKSETYYDTFNLYMEYMEGGSMCDKIRNEGQIPEEQVRKYTWQLLNGIEYLHQNKVIHHDIKGANILLDKEHENLKLTDFGTAIRIEGIITSTGHGMSNKDGMVASMYWTSPELLCSENYSYKTDIWSLGCTVVEMLTGDPPLRNDGLVMVQVLFKISTFDVKIPEQCSSMAIDFIEHCFLKQSERPTASSLLNQEHFAFPQPCP